MYMTLCILFGLCKIRVNDLGFRFCMFSIVYRQLVFSMYVRICAIAASSQALALSEQDLFTIITHFYGFALGFLLALVFWCFPPWSCSLLLFLVRERQKRQ